MKAMMEDLEIFMKDLIKNPNKHANRIKKNCGLLEHLQQPKEIE